MTYYTKLFNSIISSTIWRESPAIKVVWVTLMAMADQDGIVEASVPGLAHLSGVTVQETESAVAKFLSPDPYSRSPENEGRRIEPVDGGWRLLNHGKYREKMSLDDLREKARIRQQRFRDTHPVTPKRDASVTRRDGHNESRMSRHTEAEAKTKAEAEAEEQNASTQPRAERESGSPSLASISPPGKATLDNLAADIYSVYPRRVARGAGLKAIAKAISTVAKRGATNLHPDSGGDTARAAEWLKGRTSAYAESPQGKRTDKNYIPYPASWFNDARYDDDPSEWNQAGNRSPRPRFDCVHDDEDSTSIDTDGVRKRPAPAWLKETQ